MSEQRWTAARIHPGTWDLVDAEGYILATFDDCGEIRDIDAKARLAAAAPILRDALIALLGAFHEANGAWIDDQPDILAVVERAEAAIVASGMSLGELAGRGVYVMSAEDAPAPAAAAAPPAQQPADGRREDDWR